MPAAAFRSHGVRPDAFYFDHDKHPYSDLRSKDGRSR